MTTVPPQLKQATSALACVLYDGNCPLCRASVRILQKLDWLHRLDYVDVRHRDEPLLRHPLVTGAPLLEQMHVLTPAGTEIHAGFAAFRWLAWRLPLFCFLAPWLYIPGVSWLGQRVYLWISRHRFRLVPCQEGACTIQKKDGEKKMKNEERRMKI